APLTSSRSWRSSGPPAEARTRRLGGGIPCAVSHQAIALCRGLSDNFSRLRAPGPATPHGVLDMKRRQLTGVVCPSAGQRPRPRVARMLIAGGITAVILGGADSAARGQTLRGATRGLGTGWVALEAGR